MVTSSSRPPFLLARGRTVGLVLALASASACSRSERAPPSGEPGAPTGDCAAVAAGFEASYPDMAAADRADGARILREACTTGRWSAAVTSCFAASRSHDAEARCYGMLTPAQRQAFEAAGRR